MGDDNYSKILERIAKSSGLEVAEIDRKVEAKRAKLSGLISKEGAAQVIAAELGINFDNETFKINELLPGMRKVKLCGKIINLFPVRTFERQGKSNKVCNFILADDTSNIKVVLWDVNHISLIEEGTIKEGSSVEISNGSVRDNEIHLGSFSELRPSTEVFENVQTAKVTSEKLIVDFRISDSTKTRAFVVQAFDPRFFYVCPECKKKAVELDGVYKCETHGVVNAEKRALLNVVLDDGSETIRAVMFHDQVKAIGMVGLDSPELIAQQKENLLGKEFFFSGNVRKNSYFNNEEFVIDGIEELNLDLLISEMQK